MIDRKRVIGYQIIDYGEGPTLDAVTVQDYIYWYTDNHRNGGYGKGHVDELVLVSNVIARRFLIVEDMYKACQEKVAKLYKQYKLGL